MKTMTLSEKITFPFIILLRLVLVILAISVGVFIMVVGTKTVLAATLKPIAVVESNVLTLGDIFDDLRYNADYVLGRAPAPGQDMTLNARTLQRIAVAMDLKWRPASGDQITVRRAATIIAPDYIENLVRNGLVDQGINGEFNMDITGGAHQIVLPHGMAQTAEISSIKFDPRRDVFEAIIAAPSKDKPIRRINITGRVERLVDLPILKTSLRHGDIIHENDIDWIRVPAKNIQSNALLNAKDIAGLTPRRMVLAGKPLTQTDLEKPRLVNRGEMITLFLNDGALSLTTKAKALQSGAKGDIIKITNLSSNKTLTAMVSGTREATIR